MKTLQLRLPDGVHHRAKQLAQEEGISLNQFLAMSISNEVVRQETHDFFHATSANFNPTAFAAALTRIPSKVVGATDRLE